MQRNEAGRTHEIHALQRKAVAGREHRFNKIIALSETPHFVHERDFNHATHVDQEISRMNRGIVIDLSELKIADAHAHAIDQFAFENEAGLTIDPKALTDVAAWIGNDTNLGLPARNAIDTSSG